MAVVYIPSLLRDLCGGADRLAIDGATLGEALREVDRRCPGFFERVVQHGRLRPEIAVAIDGEASSFSLHEPVGPNAEIAIVPAIGGG